MQSEVTILEVNPVDAQLFLLFRKYQNNLTKILKSGMLDIKDGYAVVHFDSHSVIGPIERHDKLVKA